MAPTTHKLHDLFLLNVALQLFDGVATYHGMPMWGEGNPLVRNVVPYVGDGMALLLSKQFACALLVVLRRLEGKRFVVESLAGIALVYGIFSFVPWMHRFLSLLKA
jgi:hypothetical protein